MKRHPGHGESSTSLNPSSATSSAQPHPGHYQHASQSAAAQCTQGMNITTMAEDHRKNYSDAHPEEFAAAAALPLSLSAIDLPLNQLPLLSRLQANIDGGIAVPHYDNQARLSGKPFYPLSNASFIAKPQPSTSTASSSQMPVANAQAAEIASEQAEPASLPASARQPQGIQSNEPIPTAGNSRRAQQDFLKYKESCQAYSRDIKYLAKSIQGFQPFPRYVAQSCQEQMQIFVNTQKQSLPFQPLEKTAQTSMGALKVKPAFDVKNASFLAAHSLGSLAGVPYAADRLDREMLALQRAVVELDKKQKEEKHTINRHLSNMYEALRHFKGRLELCETQHQQKDMERTPSTSTANVINADTCLHDDKSNEQVKAESVVAQTVQRRDAEMQTIAEENQVDEKQVIAEATYLESEVDANRERVRKLEEEVVTLRTVVNEVLQISRAFSLQLTELKGAQKPAKVLRTIGTNTPRSATKGVRGNLTSSPRKGSEALAQSFEASRAASCSRRSREQTPSSNVTELQSDRCTPSPRSINRRSTPGTSGGTSSAERRSVESRFPRGGTISHTSHIKSGSPGMKKAQQAQSSESRTKVSKVSSSPQKIHVIPDSTDEDSPVVSSDDDDEIENGEEASSSDIDAVRPDRRAGLKVGKGHRRQAMKRHWFDDPQPSTSTPPRIKRTRPDCVPGCM